MADRYFLDENLFDELLDVENELLDQYTRGQLAPEEKKNFHKYLAGLPDGSSKLATAYTLKEARNEISVASPVVFTAQSEQTSPSRFGIFSVGLFSRPFVQYVSLVIVIGLLSGVVYLLIAQLTLQREVERLRAERNQVEQEKVNSAQQAQETEAALRDRNVQLEQELSGLKQTNEIQKRQGSETALLVLTPALRSRAAPDLLTISGATQTVLLVIPVAKDEQISNYSVIVKSTEGRLVLTRDRLRPRISDTGSTVSLRLSAAQLTTDTYKLTLQGQEADAIAQEYYFKILKN